MVKIQGRYSDISKVSILRKPKNYESRKFNSLLLSTIFACTSLFGSIALAIFPVEVESIDYSYSSRDLAEPVPLLLTADTPQSLEVNFSDISNTPDGILLTTSHVENSNSITVTKDDGLIFFGYSTTSYGILTPESAISVNLNSLQNCEAQLVYFERNLSLWCGEVNLGSVFYSYDALGPVLTHLYSPHGNVNLTTKPSISVTSPAREFVKYSAVLFVLVSLSLAILQSLPKPRKNLVSLRARYSSIIKSRFRFQKLDLFVLVYLLLAAFVAWPMDDDGNVMATSNSIQDVGGLSTYYFVSAAFLPTGNLPYLPLFDYWKSTESLFLIRIPFVVATFFTWVMVRKTISVFVLESRPRKIALLAASLFFCVSALGFISIRPEPFVALTLAVGLYLSSLILTNTGKGLYHIVHLGGIAGISLLIHQTGVTVVGLFLGVLITSFSWRSMFQVLRERFAQVSIWISTIFLTAFWVSDLRNLAQWSSDFAKFTSGSHSRPLIEEFFRYSSGLMQLDLRSVPILWLILFLLLVPLVSFFSNQRMIIGKTTLIIAISVFSLAFTPSKWVWHFGSLLPVVGVLGGLLVHFLWRAPNKYSFLISIVIIVPTISLGVASIGRGSLGTLSLIPNDFHSSIYDMRYKTIAGDVDLGSSASLLLLSLLVLFVLVFIIWSRLREQSALKLLALVVVPAFLLATSAPLMLVSALTSPGFSPARMNLDYFVDSESCGALNYTPITIPNNQKNFPIISLGQEIDVGVNILESGYVNILGMEIPTQEIILINTSDSDQVASIPIVRQSVSTSEFSETLFVKTSYNQTSASVFSESGELIRVIKSDVWIPLNLSRGAVEIVVTVPKGGTMGILTTNILENSEANANQYFSRQGMETAVIDPQLALFTPCLRTPAITRGTFDIATFAVSSLSYADLGQTPRLDVGNKYLKEFEVFELGCPNYSDGVEPSWINGSLCLYHLGGHSSK
jgi:hypothetical protein